MATTVGLLHLEFHLPAAASLKDKRRSLKGFRDRLAAGHNVSVAEVASQDNPRRGVLAVAMVGSDKRYVEGALQRIVTAAASHRDMILVESQIDWV
ncbi:MAG: DUF503 domain-containing protein [Planctomycetaceae bacterium]|nr:DUF503 domain-containing protein [Planctomycetaceae bacterium]